MTLKEENKTLRYLLWEEHRCPTNFREDDEGGLKCHKCGLDFERDDVEKIETVLFERAIQCVRNKLAKVTKEKDK